MVGWWLRHVNVTFPPLSLLSAHAQQQVVFSFPIWPSDFPSMNLLRVKVLVSVVPCVFDVHLCVSVTEDALL